jgi:hypothetical protein
MLNAFAFRLSTAARPVRRLAVVAALAALAACASPPETAAYYRDLEKLYTLTGHLRTETAPPDAPFTNADLIRNFESIAFHTEFTRNANYLESGKTPTRLVRWRGEVTYDVYGDAVGPEDERTLRELTERLAELTGLQFRRVNSKPNILIVIADRDFRTMFVRALNRRGMADRTRIIKEWSRSDRFPCVGQVGETGEASDDDTRGNIAIIGIKGETQGLLRKSCIHEEFVQTLGLMNDDDGARPSIFNDDQEFALLTAHDEYLLRILYDPRLRYGMTAEEGMPIVRQIVAEIGPGT